MPWIDSPPPGEMPEWNLISTFSANVSALEGAGLACRKRGWRTRQGWIAAT